jgi:multiple sugar transport system substrate-binding protein
MTRRNFLRDSLLATGGLALAGCGSPLEAGFTGTKIAPGTVDYWNLFGGGDGVRMQEMLQTFEDTSDYGLKAVTLTWGNPYYTKLSLATIGGRPPDVAVSHLSRVPTLVEAGQLQALDPDAMSAHDMAAEDFEPVAWDKATVDDATYAVPLDTHPFVLFYNTDICKEAGLLDSDDQLVSMDGPDAFIEALGKAKEVTGSWGGVCAINADTATNWRIFQSLYSQLGGEVLADNGTKIVLDDDLAMQTLEYVKRLSVDEELMPASIDYGGAVAVFASGDAGFFMQGEWEITTFQTAEMPFSMTLFPNVFGGDTYSCQADSHTLIIPSVDEEDPERTERALSLIKSMLDQSLTWAEGGHVPLWLPFQQSEEYRQLQPQSNYASAAEAAAYDPPAWYSGSGSNFEILMGSAVATVRAGQADPEQAIASMRSGLTTFANTPSPV